MKKLILCQHPDSIQENLPITYSISINNTNNTKLILPYYRTIHQYFIRALEYGTMSQKIFQSHPLKTFAKEYQKYILQPMT